MTGEYYICSESYEGHVGPVWFQIGIECRFIGTQIGDDPNLDYLGFGGLASLRSLGLDIHGTSQTRTPRFFWLRSYKEATPGTSMMKM